MKQYSFYGFENAFTSAKWFSLFNVGFDDLHVVIGGVALQTWELLAGKIKRKDEKKKQQHNNDPKKMETLFQLFEETINETETKSKIDKYFMEIAKFGKSKKTSFSSGVFNDDWNQFRLVRALFMDLCFALEGLFEDTVTKVYWGIRKLILLCEKEDFFPMDIAELENVVANLCKLLQSEPFSEIYTTNKPKFHIIAHHLRMKIDMFGRLKNGSTDIVESDHIDTVKQPSKFISSRSSTVNEELSKHVEDSFIEMALTQFPSTPTTLELLETKEKLSRISWDGLLFRCEWLKNCSDVFRNKLILKSSSQKVENTFFSIFQQWKIHPNDTSIFATPSFYNKSIFDSISFQASSTICYGKVLLLFHWHISISTFLELALIHEYQVLEKHSIFDSVTTVTLSPNLHLIEKRHIISLLDVKPCKSEHHMEKFYLVDVVPY